MPDDYITEKGKLDKKKKESVLYKRYEDNEDPEAFISEQTNWEDHQIKNSKLDARQAQDEFEFDYVFDEEQHVQFIQDAVVNASDDEDDNEENKMSDAERKAMAIADVRKSLPIYEFRDELLAAVEEFQVLIIVGETGSGKTTQIPQYLHEAGYTKNGQKVGCTQPRRVAAMSVATRVADELGTKPDIGSYSCLMIDEAHERTLHTDILFGLVKDIARFRKDLKLLISSATMDAEKFSRYFDDAPIFNIKGRKFPVTTYYTAAPEADYLAAAITTIMTIHVKEPPGDILLFLTGQEEIENAEQSLLLITKQLGSRISEMKVFEK
ncbi:P-loop containing nucleoside triphosphate hydrolase protein [Chytriomyces cf. hyalinus JEL632]|nr:P-loop containing nucleoside triphosphate hydrolase protein [Chytriomyces cf. hyalinus JEL632]